MKKQKKPLVLIVFLTVLVGGAAYFNTPKDQSQAPPPATDTKKDSAESVAQNVTQNLDKSNSKAVDKPNKIAPTSPGPGGHRGPGMGRPDNISTLVRPLMGQSQKPKPSLTSTSTQWYTPEANHK